MARLRRVAQLACLPCTAILCVDACRPEPTLVSRTVRDSAGIEIIEQPLDDAAHQTLAPQPELDLFRAGDPMREFYRVSDARLFTDGSIAVVNTGTQQVRVFSRDGHPVGEFGRLGEGPGEFRAPTRVFGLSGDRLLISDPALNRISVFDRTGRFLEGGALPPDARPPLVLGVLDSDRILLRFRGVGYPQGGFQPQFMRYFIYAWSTGALDSIARVASGTIGHVGRGEPWGRVSSALFDAQAHGATRAGEVVLGNGANSELYFYDPGPVVRRILRWPSSQRPVTAEDLRAYRDAVQAEMPPDEYRTMMSKQIDATPVADHVPVFEALMVDRDDRIWVQTFLRPGAERQRWLVFDLRSATVAVVDLSAAMQLFDALADTVLVVDKDALDAEHVCLYALVASEAGAVGR